MPYAELIRVSTELSSTCQALQRKLALYATGESGKPASTGFQSRMAEMMVHRFCFLMSSLHEPTLWFSRKLCLDSALKLSSLANLYVPSPSPPSTPSELDFVSLVSRAAGSCAIIIFQATLVVAAELMARKGGRFQQGLTVALGEQELYSILQGSLAWTQRRLERGETNVKGVVFLEALLVQVSSVEAKLEGKITEQAAIMDRISERLSLCFEGLKDLAGDAWTGDLSDSQMLNAEFLAHGMDLGEGSLLGWSDMIQSPPPNSPRLVFLWLDLTAA